MIKFNNQGKREIIKRDNGGIVSIQRSWERDNLMEGI